MKLFEGKDFVTPRDLAEAKFLSRSKQVEERSRGRLKCAKLSAKILYSQKNIEDYVALCERGGEENTGAEA